jgi:DNA-binding CsgD family transcriptional regulator
MDASNFTPRQRDVLTEMCKGKSNKEIARALGMAEATVKLHLTEIFRTMGVTNRAQAIIKACDFPVTQAEPPRDLTDLEILEEFTDLAFTVGDERWSQRVLKFGHAIDKRVKGERS